MPTTTSGSVNVEEEYHEEKARDAGDRHGPDGARRAEARGRRHDPQMTSPAGRRERAARAVRPSAMLPLGAAEDLDRQRRRRLGSRRRHPHAGPIAIAGLVANGANVVVTVVVARLLTSRGYGELAQLNGVFLFLSMPGSALLVGVVRRATALRTAGLGADVRPFAERLHRLSLAGVAVARPCSRLAHPGRRVRTRCRSTGPGGVVPIVAAGGFWLALSVDRGLLQARRAYRPWRRTFSSRAAMRMAFVLVLTGAGFGVTGACVGVLLGEATAAAHARFESTRRWAAEPATRRSALRARDPPPVTSRTASRRRTSSTAFGCLAFLALLQNLDVILLGREAPKHSGAVRRDLGRREGDRLRRDRSRGLPAARGDDPVAQGRARAQAARHHRAHPRRPGVRPARSRRSSHRGCCIRLAFGPRLVGASGSFATLVAGDGVSVRDGPSHQLPPRGGEAMDRGGPRGRHRGGGRRSSGGPTATRRRQRAPISWSRPSGCVVGGRLPRVHKVAGRRPGLE